MAIFGSPIQHTVKVALDERKKRLNHKIDYNNKNSILNHYGKTPWVKIHSCVEPEGSSDKRIEFTFLGTKINKGGFNELFSSMDREQPFRPPAGVESIEVSLDGNFGSIKKATINMKCWIIEDLQELETLFMTIQGSIVLQWGWSIATGLSNISSIEDEEANIFNNNRLKAIRRDSYGDYDAFVGKICNFNWSGNEENGFDISVEIMSPGDTALNIPIDTSEDNEESSIRVFFDEEWNDILDKGVGMSNVEMYEAAEFIKKDNRYVSIGYIEDHILKRFLLNNISTEFNSIESRIGMHPKLRSMTPDICVLPGNESYNIVKSQHSKRVAESCWESDYIGIPRNILVDSEVIKNAFMNASTLKDAMDDLFSKINHACLDFFELGYEIPEGEDKVKIIDIKYVKDKPKDILDKCHIFNILNRNTVVRSYSMSSNIPDSFKTAAMMGSSKAGVNSGDTIIGELYNNCIDTYKKYLDKQKPSGTETNSPTDGGPIKIENPRGNFFTHLFTRKKSSKEWADIHKKEDEKDVEKAMKDNFKSPVSENIWKVYRDILNEKGTDKSKFKKNPSLNNRIIPIEMSIVIDGISGLEYGNTFIVDNLPKRYYKGPSGPNYTYFQIIDLKHNISKDDWTTEITGLMRLGK